MSLSDDDVTLELFQTQCNIQHIENLLTFILWLVSQLPVL
jgi:hypothetical protein